MEKKSGVDKWEIHLSKFSHKTTDYDEYLRCLKEKAESDLSTLSFYLRSNWRFRMFLKRKSCEERLMNRVKTNYGKDCIACYSDWSGRYQLKAIAHLSMKKIQVDNSKTSITCNQGADSTADSTEVVH